MDQFLETPFNLDGKKASQLLGKKRRRRRRRHSPSTASDSDVVPDGDEPKRKKKKEKKNKEKEQYKSAQFIEDSDEEYGDIEAFLEKEKAMRERAQLAAAAAGGGRIGTMKPTGTKRRRKAGNTVSGNKKQKGNRQPKVTERDSPAEDSASHSGESDSDSERAGLVDPPGEPQFPSRPRPRPIIKPGPRGRFDSPSSKSIPPEPPQEHHSVGGEDTLSPERSGIAGNGRLRRNRLVISDEEDD